MWIGLPQNTECDSNLIYSYLLSAWLKLYGECSHSIRIGTLFDLLRYYIDISVEAGRWPLKWDYFFVNEHV